MWMITSLYSLSLWSSLCCGHSTVPGDCQDPRVRNSTEDMVQGASQVMFVCECMRHSMRHRSCLCVSVCDIVCVTDAMFVW